MAVQACLPAPWHQGLHLLAWLQASACNLVIKAKACSPRSPQEPSQAARPTSRSLGLLRQCQVGSPPQNNPLCLCKVPTALGREVKGTAKPQHLWAPQVTCDSPAPTRTATMYSHLAGVGVEHGAIVCHSQRKIMGKSSTIAKNIFICSTYLRGILGLFPPLVQIPSSQSAISSLTPIKFIPV